MPVCDIDYLPLDPSPTVAVPRARDMGVTHFYPKVQVYERQRPWVRDTLPSVRTEPGPCSGAPLVRFESSIRWRFYAKKRITSSIKCQSVICPIGKGATSTSRVRQTSPAVRFYCVSGLRSRQSCAAI